MSQHPFDSLKARHADRSRTLAERRHEERAVHFLVQQLGLGHRGKAVRDAAPDGSGQLTLAAFNELFPTFPLLMAASTLNGAKLHLDPRTFLPAMFKNFAAVPFVTAYEEVLEQLYPSANGRSVGLVFPRNGFRLGMVIFNETFEQTNYHGLSLVYRGGDRKHVNRLFVQPFQETILALWNKGHGWRAD